MINTRQNNKGNWWCYATIFGYDHSFESTTAEGAQQKMRDLIISKGYTPDNFKWFEPISYEVMGKINKSRIGYMNSRIDNNPIA